MSEKIDELARAAISSASAFLIPESEVSRTLVELAAKKSLADFVGVEPHEVEFLNPRWEGNSFTVDGARLR